MFLTCGDSDKHIVTKAVNEMSDKKLLPGNAMFSSFNVYNIGELKYINMLKNHNRFVNNTQILSIADITTKDLEQVLVQKIEPSTIK